ncbi:unnamed protein product, partial [marine sediment metagenome]
GFEVRDGTKSVPRNIVESFAHSKFILNQKVKYFNQIDEITEVIIDVR